MNCNTIFGHVPLHVMTIVLQEVIRCRNKELIARHQMQLNVGGGRHNNKRKFGVGRVN